MDTDMAKGLDVKKNHPHQVAARTLDALENGGEEVLVDEQSNMVKQSLSTEQAYYLNPPVIA